MQNLKRHFENIHEERGIIVMNAINNLILWLVLQFIEGMYMKEEESNTQTVKRYLLNQDH